MAVTCARCKVETVPHFKLAVRPKKNLQHARRWRSEMTRLYFFGGNAMIQDDSALASSGLSCALAGMGIDPHTPLEPLMIFSVK